MPEFLLVAVIATLFCLTRYQSIRLCFNYVRRTFFRAERPKPRNNPYRDNPEAERDRYRAEAERLALELQQAHDELHGTRMERDLAIQDRDLRVLMARFRLGSAFALGALTCFTSVNVAPQIASDMLAERPPHVRPTRSARTEHTARRDDLMIGLLTMSQRYYPYAVCAPDTCCHRSRLRLVSFAGITLRLEPAPLPIQFFWLQAHEIDEVINTSGGETPRPMPQEPEPIRVEHAEPCQNETECVISVLTATLD